MRSTVVIYILVIFTLLGLGKVYGQVQVVVVEPPKRLFLIKKGKPKKIEKIKTGDKVSLRFYDQATPSIKKLKIESITDSTLIINGDSIDISSIQVIQNHSAGKVFRIGAVLAMSYGIVRISIVPFLGLPTDIQLIAMLTPAPMTIASIGVLWKGIRMSGKRDLNHDWDWEVKDF